MAKAKPTKNEELKNTPDAPVTEPGAEETTTAETQTDEVTDTVIPETGAASEAQDEEEAKAAEAARAEIKEKLATYFKLYPYEKVFYITSDGSVFLSKAGVEARELQKQLDATKEVVVHEL